MSCIKDNNFLYKSAYLINISFLLGKILDDVDKKPSCCHKYIVIFVACQEDIFSSIPAKSLGTNPQRENGSLIFLEKNMTKRALRGKCAYKGIKLRKNSAQKNYDKNSSRGKCPYEGGNW